MNRKELKKSVFTFTRFGKFMTAIELSIIMIILGAAMSSALMALSSSTTVEHSVTFIVFVSLLGGVFGFILGYNMPFSLFVWKIFPMNKKVAIQYLKDRKTKAEAKLSDSDDCLKQMYQDYQDLILKHAQEMEGAKEKIKEIEKLLKEI
ncbi:MAG: hypothetical protein ACYC40_00405 [Patescibacteria group bacterium]